MTAPSLAFNFACAIDTPDAAEYVTVTLLGEAERWAASARHLADIAERDAVAAEAKAARLRDVAGRVKR